MSKSRRSSVSTETIETVPGTRRSTSLAKLTSLFRKKDDTKTSSTTASTGAPSTGSTTPSSPGLFRRSSSGALRASLPDDLSLSGENARPDGPDIRSLLRRPSSPETMVSPSSRSEVLRLPPAASAFEANVVTNFPVLLVVCQTVVDSSELDDASKLGLFVTLTELLKMFDNLTKFVSFVTNGECKKCQDPNTLFRETGVLVMLCRALCSSSAAILFLTPLVEGLYKHVDKIGISNFELEPSRLTGSHTVAGNASNLETVLDAVLSRTHDSLAACPVLLRIFFQTVFSIVNVRHAGYGFKALANFFFLRFLLPAIMSPSQGMISERMRNADRRPFILLTKTLQSIANGTAPEDGPVTAMNSYVTAKNSSFVEAFFVNLITARADDSVSELNTLEFTRSDFDCLRASLLGWMVQSMEPIRTRLGPMLQLHSWLASDEEVQAGMEELVQLIRSASGTLLTPPATKWKKSSDRF